MTTTRRVRITLSDLPPRAQPLAPDQLSTVFGGCQRDWKPCQTQADCCAGWRCAPAPIKECR